MKSFLRALFSILFALGLMASAPALAQAPPGGRPPPGAPATVSSKVTVDVLVLHATNGNTTISQQIPPSVIKQLSMLNFTGYSLLQNHTATLGLKQSTNFTVGAHRFELQLLSKTVQDAKIRVQIFRSPGNNKVLDTTVTVHRNKSFIVGGPPHNGGNLILPITARYPAPAASGS